MQGQLLDFILAYQGRSTLEVERKGKKVIVMLSCFVWVGCWLDASRKGCVSFGCEAHQHIGILKVSHKGWEFCNSHVGNSKQYS